MKVYLIGNTLFNYRNSKSLFNMMYDYFETIFINELSNVESDDILIHSGNLFKSSENLNIKYIIKIKKLFDKISNIIPVYLMINKNEYNQSYYIQKLLKSDNIHIVDNMIDIDNYRLISNIKYEQYLINNKNIIISNNVNSEILKKYNSNFFLNDIRPYQLDKLDKMYGYYIIQNDNMKYIQNKYSPIYKDIIIKTKNDLNKLDVDFINNNFISLTIDKNILNNDLKLDILLSKYNFKQINYINNVEKKKQLDKSTLMLDINDYINKKITKYNDNDLMNEFNEIKTIYNEYYDKR